MATTNIASPMMCRKLRFWYWSVRGMESLPEYLLILLLEGLVFLLVVVYSMVALNLDEGASTVAASITVVILLQIQTLNLNITRGTSGYVLYLAARVAGQPQDGDPGFSDNVHDLRLCLRGIARVGDLCSGGQFQNLVLKTLKERDQNMSPSLTLGQILDTLELGIIDEASGKTRKETLDPFERFVKEVRALLDYDSFTVQGLVNIIVDRYLRISKHLKKRIEISQSSRRYSKEQLERAAKWAEIAIPIVTVVITAIELVPKFIVSE